MPRYIVKYQKVGQIEGARLFDMHKGASQEAIKSAAQKTAGVGAEVISVSENDGTVPYEKRAQ